MHCRLMDTINCIDSDSKQQYSVEFQNRDLYYYSHVHPFIGVTFLCKVIQKNKEFSSKFGGTKYKKFNIFQDFFQVRYISIKSTSKNVVKKMCH